MLTCAVSPQDLKTDVLEKEDDLRDITDEKPRIYQAEGGVPSELSHRVEKLEGKWKELQSKVDARSQQFNEGLSNWNVFQGTQISSSEIATFVAMRRELCSTC